MTIVCSKCNGNHMRSECPTDEWKNVGTNNRRAEYSQLIEEILIEDAALRALGFPGLSIDEIIQLRIIVLFAIESIERKIAERMDEKPQ